MFQKHQKADNKQDLKFVEADSTLFDSTMNPPVTGTVKAMFGHLLGKATKYNNPNEDIRN